MLSKLNDKQIEQLTKAFFSMPFYSRFIGEDGDGPVPPDLPANIQKDLARHLFERLQMFREDQVPWLNSLRRLDGAKVLEIGAGTGSSTVALGEMGAKVLGIDNQPAPLEMARTRAVVHEVESKVSFEVGDAAELDKYGNSYDLIIFFASLEHLTHTERVKSLGMAWDQLQADGLLVVIECPNRLWYRDVHTTLDPLFHWLPDELAIDYYEAKSDSNLGTILSKTPIDEKSTKLARMGRGASYHEFELAIGPLNTLKIENSLTDFRRSRTKKIDKYWTDSKDARYRELMISLVDDLPEQFMYPWLDVAIRKI